MLESSFLFNSVITDDEWNTKENTDSKSLSYVSPVDKNIIMKLIIRETNTPVAEMRYVLLSISGTLGVDISNVVPNLEKQGTYHVMLS
jgi:hypothetical protein